MSECLVTDEWPLEVLEVIEGWPKAKRSLFRELLDDAASELQRELVCRATRAGHSPAAIHSFADALRPLDDETCLRLCALKANQQQTIAQLLRVQADPLTAFQLHGGDVWPVAPLIRAPAAWPVPPTPARARAAGFEAESAQALPAVRGVPRQPQALAGSLVALLSASTRGLGVSWRQVDVDLGGQTLEGALLEAARALAAGTPVAVAIGPAAGHRRRHVLLLQLNVSGKARAWQLFDPFTRELVWANERDLVARSELPFADKRNRRITHVALPTRHGAGY